MITKKAITRSPSGLLREGGGKFFVDVAEASVGEDGDDVSALELWGEGLHDGVGVGVDLGWDGAGAEAGSYVFRVEALGEGDGLGLEDAGEDDLIGEGEGVDEVSLEDVAPESVGAGLEDGDEAAATVAGAQGTEGLADGRGVVSEVVDDGDAVDLGADLEAALY